MVKVYSYLLNKIMNNVFMKRAIELAKKGKGLTSPNPCVGALIEKGGHIVAEGWHKKAGDDHAEIIAIKEVMKKSGIKTVDLDQTLFENATLYVTLEPCSHVGKTPACTEAVAAAGFKKVCIGMKDPFKKVNGRGIKFLKSKGVNVELASGNAGLVDEVRDLNQAFIKWASIGLPYVTLKAGMTLDGKIATSTGDSRWITSEESRGDARLERSMCDAVLVGAGTVRADDCELAAHGRFSSKKLLRVVVDGKLSLSLDQKVFRDENVFVACSDLASKTNKNKYKSAGIEFKSFGKDSVSMKKLLKFLASRDVQSVFVEGGSAVHGAFHDAALKDSSLVDRMVFYIAPRIFGGDAVSAIGGTGVTKIDKSLEFEESELEVVGGDMKVTNILNFY